MTLQFINPSWTAPPAVRACCTTRVGGVSEGQFAGFNLGIRSGDTPEHVAANRQTLKDSLDLTQEPSWIWQIHSARVVVADAVGDDEQADASWTSSKGTVCVVMAADCLPVLFAAQDGSCVAAAHAGWRGLSGGVLEAVIEALPVDASQLMAWLGPCIGASAFEVGEDVFSAFVRCNPDLEKYFVARAVPGKWLADLQGLARARLQAAGVQNITVERACTYSDPYRFFSYRRDGAQSGRMAGLIWIDPE
ncbi:MAG: peptidoglycan editing factor PgeF [Pseudomonadota bacterium]